MRVAFVVQRYGQEVAGGAEALCRDTARQLAARGHRVEVFTTTARDYLTWAPHYAPGGATEDGVQVWRFHVTPPDPAAAARLVRLLALDPGDAATEAAWACAQGPVSPGLLSALETAAAEFDAVALWTYLYATTQMAMPLVASRSILVPLAHDEPMLRFALTRGLMRSAAGFAFMTPEEALLVDDLHGVGGRPARMVATGRAPVDPGDAAAARARFDLPPRFALYVGRVDPAKGLDELIRVHAAYRAAGGELGLVLAGRPSADFPIPDWVVRTGFITDRERADLITACEVMVLPSRHESLSLVALEAWEQGRPTLMTAFSEVLAGQTRRSGGGLTYTDAGSYREGLSRLAGDPGLRHRLGESGRAFTAPQTWDACAGRWEELVRAVAP
ncbi:MAG: glycosyltransferase family 4 protein [Thermoleophilia bacterium]